MAKSSKSGKLEQAFRTTGERSLLVNRIDFPRVLRPLELNHKKAKPLIALEDNALNASFDDKDADDNSFELEESKQGDKEEAEGHLVSAEQVYRVSLLLQNLSQRSLAQVVSVEWSRDRERVYFISEHFNSSLLDIYYTYINEDTEFEEEQLVELAFNVLKGLEHLNQKGLTLKCKLRFENVCFSEKVITSDSECRGA